MMCRRAQRVRERRGAWGQLSGWYERGRLAGTAAESLLDLGEHRHLSQLGCTLAVHYGTYTPGAPGAGGVGPATVGPRSARPPVLGAVPRAGLSHRLGSGRPCE